MEDSVSDIISACAFGVALLTFILTVIQDWITIMRDKNKTTVSAVKDFKNTILKPFTKINTNNSDKFKTYDQYLTLLKKLNIWATFMNNHLVHKAVIDKLIGLNLHEMENKIYHSIIRYDFINVYYKYPYYVKFIRRYSKSKYRYSRFKIFKFNLKNIYKKR